MLHRYGAVSCIRRSLISVKEVLEAEPQFPSFIWIFSGVWTVSVAGRYSVVGTFIPHLANVALERASTKDVVVRICACLLMVVPCTWRHN